MNFLVQLASLSDCKSYFGQPGVVGLRVISGALIATADFCIALTLVYFVRRRRDLQFKGTLACFAAFIVACGMTQLIEIGSIWYPSYGLSGGIEVVTAAASVLTAVLLVMHIPEVLRIPNSSALQKAHMDLAEETAQRQRAEQEVLPLSEALEQRARAEIKLQSQLTRFELLNSLIRAVGEQPELASILQMTIRRLEEDFPIDFGCVCVDEPGVESFAMAHVGAKSGALGLGSSVAKGARVVVDPKCMSRFLRGEVVHEPDIAKAQFGLPQLLARGGLRSMIAAPLYVDSRVFGVLVVARREAQSFDDSDCEFMRQLGEQAAKAAHQMQLYDALRSAYNDLKGSHTIE